MNAPPTIIPSQRFIVESYDNYDSPGERCCTHEGAFETADQALACARQIVDKSLVAMRNPNQTPVDWYRTYSLFGDGVYAYDTGFNPYTYAKERIAEIAGVPLNDPWGPTRG